MKKVRYQQRESDGIWGSAGGAQKIRRMLVIFLCIVGGLSLMILSQPIRCAAKTQQSLSDEIPKEIKEYCDVIGEAYCICPELLEAIAYHESRFIPTVKSGKCYGLMQVNVDVHKERIERLGYTAEDMLKPYPNIAVAADLLEELYETYGDDNQLVLMYYAGSPGAASRYLKSGKTTKYVDEILTRSEEYERIHEK